MKTIFYLHWNQEELEKRLELLKGLQVEITSHWNAESKAKWGEKLPDVFIISLARLPSHGKAYANWLWEAKKRQHIPLIFVDGSQEKVENFKETFPRAIFCNSATLLEKVKNLT